MRVSFAGHRTDIPEVLSALDIFVHASIDEPFGITIVEAMAAGLPVVATLGGGVGEIVTDNETGLLVPPEDSDALAAAITRLIEDPLLAKTLSEAARTHARLWFSNQRMIAETTAFIERVARR